MHRSPLFAASIVLLALLLPGRAPRLAAQPVVGDLLIADATTATAGRILRRDAAGSFSTLVTFRNAFPNWITMADDNATIAATLVDGTTYASGLLARATPGGVVTTIVAHSASLSFGNGHAFEGDGSVITAHNGGVLSRYDAALQSLTPIGFAPSLLNNLASIRSTGDYALVSFGSSMPFPGSLTTFDPRRGRLTTLLGASPLISRPSDVAYDVATDELLIARFDAPGVLRFNATTRALTTVWSGANANTVVPTARRTFLVLDGANVHEITGSGVVQRTVALPNLQPTSVAEWGDRGIFLAGVPMAGSAIAIRVQSPRPSDANKAYLLGASLRLRPAIGTFGGETLYLAIDDILVASTLGTLPQVFQNFAGVLDGNARATATLVLPPQIGTGWNLPVHVGGVVLDPNAPTGVTTVLASRTFVLL